MRAYLAGTDTTLGWQLMRERLNANNIWGTECLGKKPVIVRSAALETGLQAAACKLAGAKVAVHEQGSGPNCENGRHYETVRESAYVLRQAEWVTVCFAIYKLCLMMLSSYRFLTLYQ